MTTTAPAVRRSDTSWRWAFLARHWVTINGRFMLKRIKIIQTPWFSVLVTRIYRPDAERHPHEHNRWFTSFIVKGGYTERIYTDPADLTAYTERTHRRWSVHSMRTSRAHTITTVHSPLWTVVLAGRMVREDFCFWTPEGRIPWAVYGQAGDTQPMPVMVTGLDGILAANDYDRLTGYDR